MGDRVAVMRAGVLQQCDHPQELYDHPTNLFVAGFMGSPAMNLFEATVGGEGGSLVIGSQTVGLDGALDSTRPSLRGYAGRAVVVGIRPENLTIARSDPAVPDGGSVFEGDVDLVEALGSELLVHFRTDAHVVGVADAQERDAEGLSEGTLAQQGAGVARVGARASVAAGDRIRFHLDTDFLHFFDLATGEAIV